MSRGLISSGLVRHEAIRVVDRGASFENARGEDSVNRATGAQELRALERPSEPIDGGQG